MGSKSAQNLMRMPNLLSDYAGYNLNLNIWGQILTPKADLIQLS